MIPRLYPGEIGVVLGTGPSLAPMIPRLNADRAAGRYRLFGINCTFRDFPVLDGFIACDPPWWKIYGREFRAAHPSTPAWSWDENVARLFHVEHIPGRWFDGISNDPTWISYNHSSGAQALNIAALCGCEPLVLVGFDMDYRPGERRHYFAGLSDVDGEYPPALRKHSTFAGLLGNYQAIANQVDRPAILNATPGSAMRCFPMTTLDDVLASRGGAE